MVGNNNVEYFLLNDRLVNYLYIDKIYTSNNKYYYKEKYNDRFYLLYEKDYYNGNMNNRNYDFAGYYDCIDKVLYEPSYDLRNLAENLENVKINSLSKLSKQIEQDVITFIKQYCQNNSEQLKIENKEEFNKQQSFIFDSYISYINNEFISNRIENYVPLPDYSGKDFYKQQFDFSNNKIYTQYLNKPVETVLEIGNYLTNNPNVRKDLGIMLLKNDFQNDYLKEIIINKNGKFDNLYLNKEILNCVKDIDAKNFNITIQYGKNILNFKYPKSTLVRDLELNEKDSNTYGKSYEVVKKFLGKYKESKDKWNKDSFDFANIVSITYGKNVLYEKGKSIEENKDLEEEMEK